MVVQLPIKSIFWQNDCSFMTKQPYYHSWFYDNVEELSLKKELKWPKPLAENIKSTRPKRCLWRKGYVTNERNFIRLVKRNLGGYTGEGAKQLSQVKRLLKSPCV
jgi:hypothetical protein